MSLQGSRKIEKISATEASKKGRHPTWTSVEESRYWRKSYYSNGNFVRKRGNKPRKFSRDSIKDTYNKEYNQEDENV